MEGENEREVETVTTHARAGSSLVKRFRITGTLEHLTEDRGEQEASRKSR